jgi:isochorismate hydrolase
MISQSREDRAVLHAVWAGDLTRSPRQPRTRRVVVGVVRPDLRFGHVVVVNAPRRR